MVVSEHEYVMALECCKIPEIITQSYRSLEMEKDFMLQTDFSLSVNIKSMLYFESIRLSVVLRHELCKCLMSFFPMEKATYEY